MIRIILEEYGLLGKILTIGFDNASANTASIRELIQNIPTKFGGPIFSYLLHMSCP